MSFTPNLNLIVWDRDEDAYDHNQLASNFYILDAHDHTPGRGPRITTNAIADDAVTSAKIGNGQVGTTEIADLNVTTGKLADNSVITAKVAANAITGSRIADFAVTSKKLDPNVVPLGTIIAWWRPSIGTPLPEGGWEVADGSTVNANDIDPLKRHDFPGGGIITLPNLTNKFLLGAATGGTGTGPTTPPAIGQVGGSHLVNLGHTHTVLAHSHTVNNHVHSVNPHTHTVAHRHRVEPHSHVVDNHVHLVGGHTHPTNSHTHSISHTHGVNNHSHGLSGDGDHNHLLNQRRTYSAPAAYNYKSLSDDGTTEVWRTFTARQTAYRGDQDFDAPGFIGGVPPHSHGGRTHGEATSTGGPSTDQSGPAAPTTQNNASFNTGGATPGTSDADPFTTTDTPTTSAVPLTTNNQTTTVGTSNETPGTTESLTNTDIRPGHVGVIFLIKVRY